MASCQMIPTPLRVSQVDELQSFAVRRVVQGERSRKEGPFIHACEESREKEVPTNLSGAFIFAID